jgi:hypothetical protein
MFSYEGIYSALSLQWNTVEYVHWLGLYFEIDRAYVLWAVCLLKDPDTWQLPGVAWGLSTAMLDKKICGIKWDKFYNDFVLLYFCELAHNFTTL